MIVILIIYCLFRFIYSIYLFIFINHGKISVMFKIKNGIFCIINTLNSFKFNIFKTLFYLNKL